jgi:hypothetical protein
MWLTKYLGQSEPVPKNDERVVKLKEWVDAQYASGRVTTIGKSELAAAGKELGIL